MSLKERLKARPRPTSKFHLRMVDDTEQQSALAEAKHELLVLTIKDGTEGTDELAEAQKKVDALQAEVDACYEALTLVSLPPEDFEALISAHPPTAQQREEAKRQKDDDPAWNVDTFRPSLLEACVEGDMTDADWQDMYKTGQINLGEFRSLFFACLEVNDRSTDDYPGKG